LSKPRRTRLLPARRPGIEPPPVPTVSSDPVPEPPAEAPEDQTEAAIRRMVEAAYS